MLLGFILPILLFLNAASKKIIIIIQLHMWLAWYLYWVVRL